MASDWSRAVNIVMNIDENIFRMPIYPMLNHLNIDELNISFIPQYMDWGTGGLGDISHHR